MILIKRFAAPLSLLAALAAAVAAPYMIPENPDSAVMRSGTLLLFILLACIRPLYNTLRCAKWRQLIPSLALGFGFSLALSVGSELFFYEGLLPGMGSLVRRLAVPLLAAPLLGGLCCRVTQLSLPGKRCTKPLPVYLYALPILLCWLPLLAAYFPGMLNYDFAGQYAQHTSGQYTNLHPLLHSALCNGVITLGEMLHSRTFGVLLMSLLQMILFALALGNSCAFAAKRGVPLWGVWGLIALYALHPVFSVMALSMTKDTLFAAAVLTLSLDAYALLESRKAPTRLQTFRFILCTVGTALLRGNGIFALALLFPALIAAARHTRRAALFLCIKGAAAAALTLIAFTLALQPASMPSFQLYSLPAQQLVRAYNLGSMTQEERSALESWYVAPDGLGLHPHLADPAKGYLNRERIEAEGDDFLTLWRQVGAKNPRVYAEALLMLNVGSWYPDDLSHSTIYPDVSWNDKGYLQTQEYDMTDAGIHTSCFLPAVRNLYERICRRNAYQEYPLVSVLFCTATPLWVLLIACTVFVAKKQTRLLPAALGALGLWLSYLLGPCTLPRYALPLFCLAPVLLLAALTHSPEDPS